MRNLLATLCLVLVANLVFAKSFTDLKLMLDEAKIPYIADDAKEICVVNIDGLQKSDGRTLYIRLEGSAKDFLVARITVVDKEEGFKFTQSVMRECLAFNQSTGLLKAQLDEKYADIDLSYETWASTPVPDIVRGLQLLVDNADKLAERVKKAIGR